MSGGGGKGRTSKRSLIRIDKIFDDPVRAASNIATGGLLQINDGEVQLGGAFQLADEIIGVSARAREALHDQNRRLMEEEAAAQRELANQRLQNARLDLMRSRGAEAIRNTAASRSNAKSSGGAPGQQTLGADEKDYLGL